MRMLLRRLRGVPIIVGGKIIGHRFPDGSVACVKRRYRTMVLAAEDLDRIARTDHDHYIPVRAYRCQWCFGFHLTSQAR